MVYTSASTAATKCSLSLSVHICGLISFQKLSGSQNRNAFPRIHVQQIFVSRNYKHRVSGFRQGQKLVVFRVAASLNKHGNFDHLATFEHIFEVCQSLFQWFEFVEFRSPDSFPKLLDNFFRHQNDTFQRFLKSLGRNGIGPNQAAQHGVCVEDKSFFRHGSIAVAIGALANIPLRMSVPCLHRSCPSLAENRSAKMSPTWKAWAVSWFLRQP